MRVRAMSVVLAGATIVMGPAEDAAGQATTGGAVVQAYVDLSQGVSIDTLVERALRDAPAVLAARSREAEARGTALQAGLRPNPTVSVQRREEPDTPGHQTTVGVAWPLDLFRRDARVAVATEDVGLAGGATLDLEWRLASQVRSQAGRVLAAVRRLEIALEVAQTTRATFDLVAARADTGASPALDRNQAEIAWRRHEAEAVRLRGEVEAELAALKALAGIDPASPLVLRADLESATMTLRASDPGRAGAPDAQDWLRARPDVRLAELTVDRAAARESQARQDGRLDMSLTASYSRVRAGFPQRGLTASGLPVPIAGRTHNLIVGVNLMLPWRNDNRGAIAAASAAVTTAGRALDARRLGALAEVEAARRRDASAAAALDVLGGQARTLAARNLDVVRESHALGRASLTDVLDETRRYLDFESAYTAALADAFQARVTLTTALGALR